MAVTGVGSDGGGGGSAAERDKKTKTNGARELARGNLADDDNRGKLS